MRFLIYMASNFPIKYMTLFVLEILHIFSRVMSNLKFYAQNKTDIRIICHWSTEIKYPANIIFSKGVIIGPKCTLGAKSKIFLDENVRMSKGCILETAGLDFSKLPPYPHISKEIIIKKNVWLGSNVIILGGVTIGEGSIIGAGTIISKDIPPMSVVVGSKNRLLNKKRQYS